jgi:DNA replication initiation complex subunit (GINS family)
VNEKKELLNMLREMWQKGDSPLRRIYSSLEELEANVEIKTEKTTQKEKYRLQPCPNCGAKQKITKPLEDFFPYQNCTVCKKPFYVNRDLTARKLTAEEKDLPQAWVQIVEDMSKKKMAIAFRLE